MTFPDETSPGEKQVPAPSASASPPPCSQPPYSPPAYPKGRKKDPESVDLSTLEKFLKNNERNPDAVLSTPKSKFFGWHKTRIEDKVFRIYRKRAKKILKNQPIGQKKLGLFAGKSRSQMRRMLGMEGKTPEEIQQMEWFADDSQKDIKKMIGSGLNSLIDRLYLGIPSLHAGITSVKLKNEIKTIADQLFKAKVISQEQTNKVLSLK